MNIDAIRYFVAVAQSKSISKAAGKLYLTQPALSRSLQRLEEELGVSLIIRKRNRDSCGLTEAGQKCLGEAVKLLDHYANFRAITDAYERGERGSLKIGYGDWDGGWMVEWTARIRRRFPEIQITLERLNFGESMIRLKNGELDLAILATSEDLEKQGLASFCIRSSHPQVLVSKDHSFSHLSSVRIEDLAGQKLIVFKREVSPDSSDAWQALFRNHGVSMNIYAQYDTMAMVLSEVYAENAVTFYDSIAANPDEKHFAVINLEMEESDTWPLSSGLSVAYRRDAENPCVKNAVRLLQPSLL